MGIVDIVLIVILFIALIVGLKKGLAGIFFGFAGFLIIGVALGFLVNFAAPYVVFSDVNTGEHSSIGEMVYEPIYNIIPTDGAIGDILHTTINISEGGEITFDTTIVINEVNVDNPTLEQVLSASVPIPEALLSFVASFIASSARDGQTFAATLTNVFTINIVGTVMWMILAFVLTIIKNIIRRLVYKWLDAHGTASKVDRAIGAGFAVLLIICVVWGAGLFLTLQEDGGADWAVSANDYIEDNTLLVKQLNESNLFIMIVKGDTPGDETPSVD